jgi:hypothetical protein
MSQSLMTTFPPAKAWLNTFASGVAQRRKKNKSFGQFVFLDQTRYDVNEYVTVLGCTLYSYILDDQLEHVSLGLNDFYNTEDWGVHLHRQAHQSDLKWLNDQVRSISQSERHGR